MAILVDELREYPGVALPFTHWCHLATDGAFEELHAFAPGSACAARGSTGDHYDLPPPGRERALALGAEEVATGELLARMTGPRGERARRRALHPRGLTLAAPASAGRARCAIPPATSWSSAARPAPGSRRSPRGRVDGAAVPVLDPDEVRAGMGGEAAGRRRSRAGRRAWPPRWPSGGGAVAVATALRFGHRDRLARLAARRAAPPTSCCSTPTSTPAARAASRRAPRASPTGSSSTSTGSGRRSARALAAPGDAAGVAERFASVTVLDRAAAAGVRRIRLG